MKIKDVKFYPRFILSTIDGKNCLSTTDLEVLKHIKSNKTNATMRDYTIGDVIYFDSDVERFKVINILIRRLVDDSQTLNIGFDTSDCDCPQGEIKEPLFIIHITIEKVDLSVI